MCTWIFRMHRRWANRLPSGITFGGRIAVEIAVANGGDRPPELIFILRVEHGNKCIGSRDRPDANRRALSMTLGFLAATIPVMMG